MIAVEVVSTLCFAFKGVTFYLRGDFTHLQCHHAGVRLYAPRGDLTRRPSNTMFWSLDLPGIVSRIVEVEVITRTKVI